MIVDRSPYRKLRAAGVKKTRKRVKMACSPQLTESIIVKGAALKVRIINYGKLVASAILPAMAQEEAERVLRASVGQQIQIVLIDGLRASVQVDSVDEEGFVYTGPEPSTFARNFELVRPNPASYWTPFGQLASIESSA